MQKYVRLSGQPIDFSTDRLENEGSAGLFPAEAATFQRSGVVRLGNKEPDKPETGDTTDYCYHPNVHVACMKRLISTCYAADQIKPISKTGTCNVSLPNDFPCPTAAHLVSNDLLNTICNESSSSIDFLQYIIILLALLQWMKWVQFLGNERALGAVGHCPGLHFLLGCSLACFDPSLKLRIVLHHYSPAPACDKLRRLKLEKRFLILNSSAPHFAVINTGRL
ncbi:hypothetical protein RRG08_043498 [Elysia crispata]|uniref:Uncharacterized protein n=1 Tax=Elysia crispata TaxID=231223 RepID=A0AAE0YG39_9GAST|nr:hypothetical protein RRG08_043498 [Elysia crispata]